MEKVIDLKKEEAPGKIFLKWEVRKEKKDKNWQIGVVIFILFSFFFFLSQGNYFGIILIFVITFLIFFLPRRKGTQFAILERGVKIGNEVFPWQNLKGFWIFEDPPELYLKSKKSYLPYIILPLLENHPEKVKKIVLNFLPEEEMERGIFDIIERKLGF